MIQNKFYQVDLLKKAIFFTWGVTFIRAQFKQIITSCTIFRLRWFAKHPRLQSAAANYRLFPILVYIHITTSRSFGFISNNHINATALRWRSKRWFISGHDIHIRFHNSPYLWVLIYARDQLCFLKAWQSYYNLQSLKPRGIYKLSIFFKQYTKIDIWSRKLICNLNEFKKC